MARRLSREAITRRWGAAREEGGVVPEEEFRVWDIAFK